MCFVGEVMGVGMGVGVGVWLGLGTFIRVGHCAEARPRRRGGPGYRFACGAPA